jgi:hypothetical protein
MCPMPESKTRKDKRIAMWSGPRTISTAMLRSWGNRSDTFVCDEPLYAHYIKVTDVAHPGREEILSSGETDWRRVVAWLTGKIPRGKAIFFQKHMAHHLLPGMGREWLIALENFFLIRDPREMLTSLAGVVPEPRVEDTGLPQQRELFEMLRETTGTAPPVVDAKDILVDPGAVLKRLCGALNVRFERSMLAWDPGPRDTDGVWAKYWYSAVLKSTGFQAYVPKRDPVPAHLRDVYEECVVHYESLHAHRLRV